jgi:hypothetical protein
MSRAGRPRRGRQAVAVWGTVLLVAGCGSKPSSPALTGPAASCARPSPIAVGKQGPEITGRGRGAQLHGLIMATRFPVRSGRRSVKIVWRMTGSGPLKLAAYDAHGRKVALAWVEPHGGSNYRRPGDEWGSGYHFRHPGCYRLTARRTVGSAEAWLRVRA